MLLKGGTMKELYEMKGKGHSIRGIARELGLSRNSVRKYLRSEEVPRAKPRERRGSKLDRYTDYINRRMSEGLENCVVLLRELRARGYEGGYSVLKEYVGPRRRPRQPQATERFETAPGEQAQVDWGSFAYLGEDGRKHGVWAFVMILGWSRAIYVELVRSADVATFMQCHVNAFEYFRGVPRQCLYDNAKVVVLGRDEAGRNGTGGCWTSPCGWVSSCGCAGPTGPRPRARWRAGSSTPGAICDPVCASPTLPT